MKGKGGAVKEGRESRTRKDRRRWLWEEVVRITERAWRLELKVALEVRTPRSEWLLSEVTGDDGSDRRGTRMKP